MKNLGLLKPSFFFSLLILIICSCQREEEVIAYHPGFRLVFSSDTIHFDTLFTTVGSVTKRLKVYNPSNNAVRIDEISLGENESPYMLYVNGQKGKSFHQEVLLGKDSLLVLVEVKIDPSDETLPFIVTDSIRFLTNGNLQDIKLITWGQDAHFISKMELACDTVWGAGRPIVLLDTIWVKEGCTLTIAAGTKIYANRSAVLAVAGTLQVSGTAESPVLFTSSRLDIKNAFGQWGGIIFYGNSNGNSINHCKIRNAVYGIYIDTPDNNSDPDLILTNTLIENAIVGLLAFGSDIHATNLVVANSAELQVVNLIGGNYFYNHCTFANFNVGLPIPRKDESVILSNHFVIDGEELYGDMSVEIHNSIIWGTLKDEIYLAHSQKGKFDLAVNHTLLKTTISQFEINNNLLNKDPKFVDYLKYDYRIDSDSPVIDKGDPNYFVALDILGNQRDPLPDMGAYEWKNND